MSFKKSGLLSGFDPLAIHFPPIVVGGTWPPPPYAVTALWLRTLLQNYPASHVQNDFVSPEGIVLLRIRFAGSVRNCLSRRKTKSAVMLPARASTPSSPLAVPGAARPGHISSSVFRTKNAKRITVFGRGTLLYRTVVRLFWLRMSGIATPCDKFFAVLFFENCPHNPVNPVNPSNRVQEWIPFCVLRQGYNKKSRSYKPAFSFIPKIRNSTCSRRAVSIRGCAGRIPPGPSPSGIRTRAWRGAWNWGVH